VTPKRRNMVSNRRIVAGALTWTHLVLTRGSKNFSINASLTSLRERLVRASQASK
jgi:hypothetical protein